MAAACLFVNPVARGNLIVNGDFEDPNFPNGWEPLGTVSSVGTMFGTSAAELEFGDAISQTMFGSPNLGLSDFQLDFAFRLNFTPGPNEFAQRIQILSPNAVNVAVLGFSSNSIQTFSSDGWQKDLLLGEGAIGADTNYFVRLVGRNFDDQASRSYDLGFSTDGVNYVAKTSTRFNPTLSPLTFGRLRFAQNAAIGHNLTIDNVSVTAVPEPAAIHLVSMAGIAGLVLARRRKFA
jgi:hypothetical protein